MLLQPLPSIAVNIDRQFDNPGEPGTPQVQVQLIPKGKRGNRGRLMAASQTAESQGAFMIRGVEPGEYQVLVQPFGATCVESLFSGSVDLTQNDLIVAAGPQPAPINVAVRKDCASISGTVRSENQTASGLIVLIPHSLSTEPKVLPIGTDGSFIFNGLSPGEYQIYAFSNIDGLEYANPEALRDFAGQKIELTPNQKSNVTLDLIARGGN